jgi:hypothetical protein
LCGSQLDTDYLLLTYLGTILVVNIPKDLLSMLMRIFTITTFCLFWFSTIKAQFEGKSNSLSFWASPEYGLDLASLRSPSTFRDGFFYSTGIYYRHDFERWYIRPGISYNQMLLTNDQIDEPAYSVKIHRMGLSFSGGYYVLDNPNFRIGLGCGIEGFYNIAGITWEDEFREETAVPMNRTDLFSWGLEFNAHTMFIYRFNNQLEVFASPFVVTNAIPVLRPAMDHTLRMGVAFGVGYGF